MRTDIINSQNTQNNSSKYNSKGNQNKQYRVKKHYCKEWLTKEELKVFIDAIEYSEHRLFFKMLYGMALRVSELLKIKVQDLQLKEGVCKLWDTKTDYFQVCLIPDWLINDIKEYIALKGLSSEDELFNFNNRKYVWELAKKYSKKADLDKDISTHTFRRSRALHLLNDGVPLEKVSKYLRHKSIGTTMSYIRITVVDLKQELDKIDDWYDL
ncbi:integrase/recombinase XerD [Methanococcus voltae]|uniref:tyrosine-type recombinase/integrase n=1 Tax=Methanococcus voltae TaxID=2188 RepID=UPI001AE9CE41|nr:tyrosine-type recombinase/integrase [Methanococcus voltae]MBP2143629.1 integrase/recombinase XerD [Methanococcus voltae]